MRQSADTSDIDDVNRFSQTVSGSPLRVLLVGEAGPANVALSKWLGEWETLEVAGPVAATAEVLAPAASFRPDVALLDFHGLPVSTSCTVSLFKGLSTAPLVFVLTHDASETMRRRCREERVDAVFDKTTELETVATVLEQTRKSFAESAASPATPIAV